jgi:Ca-activated chloride channel homolog
MAIMLIEQPARDSACRVRRARLNLVILQCLLALMLGAPCLAQTVDQDVVRVDSDLVNLHVSVLGHSAAKAPDALEQKDFVVLDEGEPQEVKFFASADAPFDLLLLLDLSSSSSNKLKLIRKSAVRFVEAARPLDRIAILTFTDKVQVISPFTSNHEELKESIKDIEEPSGGTNFWDALHYALLAAVRAGQESRRSAIVVMTDGVDNALPDVPGEGSQTTFEELLNIAGRSEAVIFPVYLDTEKEEIKRQRALRSAYVTARAQLAQLAEISGTEVHRADKLTDLQGVYEQIIRDLGTVYSIGYRPTNNARDGKWHKVSVEVVKHPNLTTHTRSGYYARPPLSSAPD